MKHYFFSFSLILGILYTDIVSGQINAEQTGQVEQNTVKFYLDLDPEPLNQNLTQLNVEPGSIFHIAVYAKNLPSISGQSFEVRYDPKKIIIRGFELYPEGESNIIVTNFEEFSDASEKIDQIKDFIQPPRIGTFEDGLIWISTRVSSGESSKILSYKGQGFLGGIVCRVNSNVAEVTDTEVQVQNHRIAYTIHGTVKTLIDTQKVQMKIIPPYAQIAGDFDESGHINFTDFLSFLQEFGKNVQSPNWQPLFDLNQDLAVDFADFSIFAQNFGKRTR